MIAARWQKERKEVDGCPCVAKSSEHIEKGHGWRLQSKIQTPKVTLDSVRNMMHGHWLYLDQVRACMKVSHCFELCLDSSRFGGREVELTLAYSPDQPLDVNEAFFLWTRPSCTS